MGSQLRDVFWLYFGISSRKTRAAIATRRRRGIRAGGAAPQARNAVMTDTDAPRPAAGAETGI